MRLDAVIDCIDVRLQMRRFITFVDCMYDKGVRVSAENGLFENECAVVSVINALRGAPSLGLQLHCLAAAPAELLYQVDPEAKGNVDELFAFDRTVSRLMEVRHPHFLTVCDCKAFANAAFSALCSSLRWEARRICKRTARNTEPLRTRHSARSRTSTCCCPRMLAWSVATHPPTHRATTTPHKALCLKKVAKASSVRKPWPYHERRRPMLIISHAGRNTGKTTCNK